jgi:hypothetical protein
MESDDWGQVGEKINSPESLSLIRNTLEDAGPIIVEWWHYRGSRAPDRLVFEDYESFVAWLGTTAAGDSIWVWDWSSVCRDDNPLTHGKLPNERGEVPAQGAY